VRELVAPDSVLATSTASNLAREATTLNHVSAGVSLPARASAASRSGTQTGTSKASATRLEPPMWSGWACVTAWAESGLPCSALIAFLPIPLVPASTSTSPSR